ncbi:hypothetical protein Agabi119p4_6649 [Agaricus bisporus var. burnettii]|uniref:Spt20-like SEP domain-containing protein n=1 Tax=Agaricus bisporus var. burnettii TaxID=192524 RepID=A0A8H7C9K1_AGABI|nr:hypothetical protein Agabi119p4_6649 [Agaricus bisporus var. burnettii]
MAASNRTRAVDDLLTRTSNDPPSFTVHLHQEHWVLNNGSKFLYHNQTACILDDIRANRIPVDFLDLFDSAKVPFYDGCMIVELLDYRPQRNKEPTPEKPDRTRVVLHPNSETLWSDICSLNSKRGDKLSDLDAIDIESKIIHATAPPLCLDPDPHLTRIVNHILRVTAPTVPNALKRKAAALEPEDDENEKSRRAKIMAFSNPTRSKLHNPNYRLLDLMMEKKRSKSQTPAPAVQASGQQQFVNQSQPQPQAAPQPPQPAQATAPQLKAASPSIPPAAEKKLVHQRPKTATPQAPYAVPAYVLANGSHTPMPPQPAANTQFIHHQPTQPPIQNQTYAGAQPVTEVIKQVPTPAPLPPQTQGRHPQHHPLPYAHATPQSITHSSPPAQAPTPLQTAVHQNIATQPQVTHQTIPHHIQQPPRPPSQAQMLRASQTPMPIQQHPPHLQAPQGISSPIQHHSPHHRPPSQPQTQQLQQAHAPQASPRHLSKQIQRTPQMSHTPVMNQATTPRQYAPSPKPLHPPPNVPVQVPGRTGPTPQPQPTPVMQAAPVYPAHSLEYMRMRGQPQPQTQQQHTGGIPVNGSSNQPVQVQVQQPPPQPQPPQQQPQPQQPQTAQNAATIIPQPNGNQVRMTPQQQLQYQLQYQLARAGRAGTPASGGGQLVMNPNGGPGAPGGMTQQQHAQALQARMANPQFQATLQQAAAARGITPQQFQQYTPQQQILFIQSLQRPAAAMHPQNHAAHAQALAQAQHQQQQQPGGGGAVLSEPMKALVQHRFQAQAQAHHQQQQQAAQIAAQGGQPNQMKPAQGQNQGQGVQPGQQPNAAAAAAANAGMQHQYYLQMGYPTGYGWNPRMMMGGGGQGGAAGQQQQQGQQGQGQAGQTQQQVQAQQMAMAANAAMAKNGATPGQMPNR